MQITKRADRYGTQDGQDFGRLSDAQQHAKRLAICHYLRIVLLQLRDRIGPFTPAERRTVDAIAEATDQIMLEQPALTTT